MRKFFPAANTPYGFFSRFDSIYNEKEDKVQKVFEQIFAVLFGYDPFDGEIEGLEKYDERKYGKTYITFFRKK